jgi:hypothetical protein
VLKLRPKLLCTYLLFLITYSAFTLLPAPQPAVLLQYHLSSLGLRAISLTIVIILAVIWYIGFYSFDVLHKYALRIKKEKDGKQVNKVALGIFFLIMWLPVSSTLSAISKYATTRHPDVLAAATIVNNYVNLLFPLVGFVLIGLGTRGLLDLTKQRPSYRATNILAALLIYIGIIYYRLVATTTHRTDIYHMSMWWIALTLVAPYIYMWFTGFIAAYELYIYQHKVAGVVYRRSWHYLSLGLGWLIITTISFQYLTTLSARLGHLSIYWLLTIVYSLLAVLSVGFVLIAIGTRKLQKIEEV